MSSNPICTQDAFVASEFYGNLGNGSFRDRHFVVMLEFILKSVVSLGYSILHAIRQS